MKTSCEGYSPIDIQTNPQLDDMHEFWTLVFGDRNVIAPVRKLREILDIGCGTGSWCVDVADEFPSARVFGIDLSPVQPVYVADNCTFLLENVLHGTGFLDEQFDLIQSRCLGAGISDVKWPKYIQEIKRITKRGGWIQLIEMDPARYCDDNCLPENSALAEWERTVQTVMLEKYDTTIHGVSHKLARLVQNAGFTNINRYNIKAPVGKWAQGIYSLSETDGRSTGVVTG
jgi:SAM-dependent methyltransferase